MFVWTTQFPLFPIRVKTSERPAERETPAPTESQTAAPRPNSGNAGS
jgi:hypothetical protein